MLMCMHIIPLATTLCAVPEKKVLANAESGKGWERVSLNFQFSYCVEVRTLCIVHESCMLLVETLKEWKSPRWRSIKVIPASLNATIANTTLLKMGNPGQILKKTGCQDNRHEPGLF